MRAAALLARLDQDHAAAVRRPGRREGLEGADGGEDGVAVVRGPPAVEAVALAYRDERVEPFPPAPERWLLVEVAVQQGGEPRRCAG